MTETCDTCSTCFYYRPDNADTGRCRLHAPITRDANEHIDTIYEPEGCWPRVQAHDWCGEHAAARNDEPTPRRQWITAGTALTLAGLTGAISQRIIHRNHASPMHRNA